MRTCTCTRRLHGMTGWFALLGLFCLAALPALAGQLTLERILASPALSGPGLLKVKISPDGSRVAFLRARKDDRLQFDLWALNVADQSTGLIIDSKLLQPTEQLSE
jgi:dipeptidyl-peptidase-4